MRWVFRLGGAAAPVVLTFVTALIAPLPARADDGAARVSVVNGTVAIQRGEGKRATDAAVDAPVVGGDYVTTGAQSRAEVQFDEQTAVRLGENVQLRVAHVDGANRHVQLAAGTIEYRLLGGSGGTTTIDTPSISIVPRSAGSYRISVDGDGTTDVTVRAGSADITTPHGTQPLQPGATLVASGAAADPQITLRAEIAYDGFDAFNQDRDRSALARSNTGAAVVATAVAPPSYADPVAPPSYAYPYAAPPPVLTYRQPVVWPAFAVVAPLAVRVPSYAVPNRLYAAWSVRVVSRPYASWRARRLDH